MLPCPDCDAPLERDDGTVEPCPQPFARYHCPECGGRFECDASSWLAPVEP